MLPIAVRPPLLFASGAVAVALSDIYQGPTLLLVLVAPIGIAGHEHAATASVASWRPQRWRGGGRGGRQSKRQEWQSRNNAG
jgi:hypothetical protein